MRLHQKAAMYSVDLFADIVGYTQSTVVTTHKRACANETMPRSYETCLHLLVKQRSDIKLIIHVFVQPDERSLIL